MFKQPLTREVVVYHECNSKRKTCVIHPVSSDLLLLSISSDKINVVYPFGGKMGVQTVTKTATAIQQ